jgi:DNA ligase D-like protein (predicted 3'-phosphoesterase)
MNKGLSEYERKRHFETTPEPRAMMNNKHHSHNLFVIQKHDATALHYDLRLEISGLLKSWAVPKGPSLDPRDKRLAILTEDHPLAYADFEGIIPEGEYGAGSVIVWDHGTFKNLRESEEHPTSLEASFVEGKIEFSLTGHKLSGGFALIRGSKDARSQWFLIKLDDEHADARKNPVSSQPESVISGRTIEDLNFKHCGVNPEA